MRFAHLGDCHLGGWRQPELKELNFRSFQTAIDKCIRDKVEFVLIAGDLFDSSYPPIDTLKEVFREFKRLYDFNIPVFLIAGSHDYSVSGKSFLDVLEKAGFCKNVSLYEERNEKIMLMPTIYKGVAIYGYPGKKSGMEVDEIERLALQDAPGMFKIMLLHTAIRDAVGTLPIKAVDENKLPKVDYLALGHLHIHYAKKNMVYAGPIFPNTLSELEELKGGSFIIFDYGKIRREEIILKEVLTLNIEMRDALTATDKIISIMEKEALANKIVIIKLFGILESGKGADINFNKIEEYARKNGAYVVLKSTTKLHLPEPEVKIDLVDTANLEQEIIRKFIESNPHKYNSLIHTLMRSLQMERLEDERSINFEERLISENKKALQL